ncbi:MAG: hypothetical protein R3E50_01730 [Halioglobus sp.]
MKKYYMELFEAAIEEHGLIETWRDGLFTTTEEQRDHRADSIYKSAKRQFFTKLYSPKNKGDHEYFIWALETYLGIKATRARYRKALDGRLRT